MNKSKEKFKTNFKAQIQKHSSWSLELGIWDFGLFLFFLLPFTLSSQDIHFSQYYFSPLTLNPAHTGFFNGQHRFATNYKTQWKDASGGHPYLTFSGSYDVHILKKLMTMGDMAGFGLSAFSDKAGTGNMSTSGVFGSLAYHRDMIGDGAHLVSMAIQGGMVQTGFDRNKLRFGDEILSDSPAGSGQEIFDRTTLTYYDVNAGVLYNLLLSKSIKFYLGASTYHLSKPQVNFNASGPQNFLSMRTTIQAGASFSITRQWDVLPGFLYMTQLASKETNFGMAIRYNMPGEASIRLGSWYRLWENADAFIMMLGLEYKNWTLGMSYDYNVSTLKQTSNGQGGFEIALINIIKSKKAVGQDIRCPSF